MQLICDLWHAPQHIPDRLKKIQTPIAVTHLGFIIREQSELFFVHAKLNASIQRICLSDYLIFLHKNVPHISGIRFEAICPQSIPVPTTFPYPSYVNQP